MAKDVKHNFVSLDPAESGAKLSCAELFIIFYYMCSVWLKFNNTLFFYLITINHNNIKSSAQRSSWSQSLKIKSRLVMEIKKLIKHKWNCDIRGG